MLALTLGTATLSGPQIAALPDDPVQLTASLRQFVNLGNDGAQHLPADAQVFSMIEAITSLPVNQELRLAAVQAGSALTGVTTTADAVDEFGNRGTSLSFADAAGENFHVLVNPNTGLAKSSRDVLDLGNGAPAFVCTTQTFDTGTSSEISGG